MLHTSLTIKINNNATGLFTPETVFSKSNVEFTHGTLAYLFLARSSLRQVVKASSPHTLEISRTINTVMFVYLWFIQPSVNNSDYRPIALNDRTTNKQ